MESLRTNHPFLPLFALCVAATLSACDSNETSPTNTTAVGAGGAATTTAGGGGNGAGAVGGGGGGSGGQGDSGVVQLALGDSHSCARLVDGTVKCWGYNGYGLLGDGTATSYKVTPTPVPGLMDVAELALGDWHTCVRLAGGAVQCWGRNDYGQIGGGTAGTGQPTPMLVSGLTDVDELALGAQHTCAHLSSGAVDCWGWNVSGQLGDGTWKDKSTPTPVPGLAGVAQLALGEYHSCARLTDGTAQCWGNNNQSGQLGDGTKLDKPTPTPVLGLADVVELAVGGWHGCAVSTGGTVQCWGDNSAGQLGDGTSGPGNLQPAPVPVPGLTGVVELALGSHHSCARLTDGTVQCWGDNYHGQLGDGTKQQRSTPTPVPGLAGVVELVAGSNHGCARLTGGAVQCWGHNENGKLGDGTGEDRPSPTPVVW